MFYTYVLVSNSTGKRYIGHTNNLDLRLVFHNSGKSPYTRGRGPWFIVHSEIFATRGKG
jgi:putative endonuclease